MNPCTQYLSSNWVLISKICFFGLLNITIKIMLRIHPVADWVDLAERRPRLLALLRLCKAIDIDPIALVQSVIDLVRGEASKGTVASMAASGVSASKPMISPRKADAVTDPEIKTHVQ
jgi:hypothetical protein